VSDADPGVAPGPGGQKPPTPADGDDMVFVDSADELAQAGDVSASASETAAPPDVEGPAFADEAPPASAPPPAPPTRRPTGRHRPPPGRAGPRPRSSKRLRPPPGAPPRGRRPSSSKRHRPPPPDRARSSSGRLRPPPSEEGERPRSKSGRLRPPPSEEGERPRSKSGRLRPPPEGGGPEGPPRRRPSSSKRLAKRPSGRMRPVAAASSSGAFQALEKGSSGEFAAVGGGNIYSRKTHPGAEAGQDPSERPARSEADRATALAALEAQVQPAPHGDPFMGRELGPFRVERFLAIDRGERRYIATHDETQEPVLLQVFPFVGSFGDEFRRMADRGERAARIEHRHLARTLGAGRTKECLFVGVEPPLGPTLQDLLADGPLPEEEVREVLDQVSRGLYALHQRDLAHCQVSPAAIRREREGHYLLYGAGVARPRAAFGFLAAGGDVLGEPGFIAPETVDTGQHDARSDLYALGCVAWALLAGRPPFTGSDEVQVLLDQLNVDVPRLEGTPERTPSEGMVTVVGNLTGYTPKQRYQSSKELVRDLKTVAAGERVSPLPPDIRPEDAWSEEGRKVRDTGNLVLLVLLLIDVALAAVVGGMYLQARAMPMDDPLDGYVLPLPEASDGAAEAPADAPG